MLDDFGFDISVVVDESAVNKKTHQNGVVAAPGNNYDKELSDDDFEGFCDKTPSRVSSMNLGNSDLSTIQKVNTKYIAP